MIENNIFNAKLSQMESKYSNVKLLFTLLHGRRHFVNDKKGIPFLVGRGSANGISRSGHVHNSANRIGISALTGLPYTRKRSLGLFLDGIETNMVE